MLWCDCALKAADEWCTQWLFSKIMKTIKGNKTWFMGNDNHDKCLPYMNHDLLGFFQQNVNFCALRWQVVWRKNVLLNFSKCILLATWVTHCVPYVNDFVTRRSYFCGSNLRQISPSPISCFYHQLANCNYWCLQKITMDAYFQPTEFAAKEQRREEGRGLFYRFATTFARLR